MVQHKPLCHKGHWWRIQIFTTFMMLLCATLSTIHAQAQDRQLSGLITDDHNQPVPGASIQIKGTSIGTVTTTEGKFVITVKSTSILVITSIGFAEREIAVGGQQQLNIQLKPVARDVSEVVVVGYGTQKRKDVTGSTVSVSEATLREVPSANLQQALQGKAAGLEIQRAGTTPGSGAVIRIRGTRSISGQNDPLFVVDGIPFEGSLNDLNPDDIATIDILKDASATAIYGSRGANGIVMVTTKRGKNGDTRISYNGYHGIATVANKYPVFNATEYQAMRNISPWGQGYMPEEKDYIAKGKSTDWQDLMYNNGYRTDHNLTVSGGNNGNTFSLGGGYYKETAVLPGQDFSRYSIRATIDSRIGKRVKVGISTLNQIGITNGAQFVASGTMFPILAMSPLEAPYDSLGKVRPLPNGNIDDNNTPTYSPLLLKNNDNNWVDRQRRLTTNNSIYGEYEIIDGLKYRVNLGVNYRTSENDQFQSADNPAAGRPSFFRGGKGNTAYVYNDAAWGYTLEHLLLYDKTFAQKHHINFTGLYSIQENHSHYTSVRKDSITEDFVQFYNLAQSNATPAPVVAGDESSWALLSYMARINYAFDERYMLTLTARMDGSSRLAAGNKWHSYPAISAGWNISKESFMQSIGWISSLKLRAGWGQTSNQAVSPYSSLGLVTNNNYLTAPGNTIRYNFGPTVVTGYQVVSLPNPNLEWEYTQTRNFGVDFGLLDNRLSGSLEYYYAKTNNILYGVSLPPTSGVAGNYTSNVGEMENKGMELSLSSVNVRSRSGFTWTTDLNLYFNRNKVLKLSNGVTQDIANQLFVGYPMSAIYDYKKLGIWQTSEAAEAAKYGATPGQIKLEDHGGPGGKPDGVISELYDRYVIGDMDARLQGGMTNRFSYKGVDLSFTMYARFGGLLVSQVHQSNASYLTVMDGKRSGIKVDYWTPTNPSNWFPEPQTQISNISTAWTTLGYYDATFLKLRSINLGYSFSNAMLQRLKAQKLRLYFTVDNVATLFSPYFKQTGIDPEGTGTGSQGVGNPGNLRSNTNGNGAITIGVSTPPSRTYTFGANVSF
ncbi:TonB-dependent receptor [Chitinophaga sp. Cy-1792]|uniref:SusC/RagA family TonB-linked outer membrane protein n=1 Tax=Chitinophaga sp. Cy-1792 TaxID=2608339 RepID=UPI0014201574|nr:TonB-dependent receptor [Chitinophaga sp. Cy-1792]NIG55994.1 TonB-dependent receptor [Chitinophaga sp. Cy-1792]